MKKKYTKVYYFLTIKIDYETQKKYYKVLSMNKHLDLGCGRFPRNPLNQTELFGVDIRDLKDVTFNYKQCNLITQKYPTLITILTLSLLLILLSIYPEFGFKVKVKQLFHL